MTDKTVKGINNNVDKNLKDKNNNVSLFSSSYPAG